MGGLNESAGFYTCYTDSSSKAMPIARMLAYLQAVANSGPPLDGQLYAMQVVAVACGCEATRRGRLAGLVRAWQALWQQSTASTAIGELEGSSLLLDEVKSQLHVLLEQWITSKQLNSSAINMLEANPPPSHRSPAAVRSIVHRWHCALSAFPCGPALRFSGHCRVFQWY